MRVVIAEDSLLLREGLATLLTDAGFEVVARAADADDGRLAHIGNSGRARRPAGGACEHKAQGTHHCQAACHLAAIVRPFADEDNARVGERRLRLGEWFGDCHLP